MLRKLVKAPRGSEQDTVTDFIMTADSSSPPNIRHQPPPTLMSETRSTFAVRLREVSFGYRPGDPVFAELNWQLATGDFVGLIGPNGAGKTTLLHLIAGLMAPQAGSVSLFDTPLDEWASRARARHVALVSQEGQVPFDFAVREVVAMGRFPYHRRFSPLSEAEHELVERCLEALGLDELAEVPVSRLSGGERQRVAIARALAQTPRLLLLDEALNHLDVRHLAQTVRLVRELHATCGVTVLAVMHDLTLAAAACPTLALLDAGRVLAEGAPAEVLEPSRLSNVYGLPVRVHEIPQEGAIGVAMDFRATEELAPALCAAWGETATR